MSNDTKFSLNRNAIRFLQILAQFGSYDTYASLYLVGVNTTYLKDNDIIFQKGDNWYLTEVGKMLAASYE